MLTVSSLFHILLGERRRGPVQVRLIVGAGEDRYQGWVTTDKAQLDILREADWGSQFEPNSVDAIVAEHVWEHLDGEAAIEAAQNCFTHLKPGGYIRVAVPDGLHPDDNYIERVRPGGWGEGSDDHHILYTYRTLKTLFESVGFRITLLEYFDERGTFHYQDWSPADGMIRRSARFDNRNLDGYLTYTSIILDARKPANHCEGVHVIRGWTPRMRKTGENT